MPYGPNGEPPNSVWATDSYGKPAWRSSAPTFEWTAGFTEFGDTTDALIASMDGTLSRCDVVLLVESGAVVAAPVVFDVEKSVDGGATWTSIFSVPNRPTVALGQLARSVNSGLGQIDITSCNAGDLFHAVWISGSAVLPGQRSPHVRALISLR